MESLDKNQSYFFLFNKETYTLEQVRSFTLEDCYRYCINDEWCDDTCAIDEDYNLPFTNSGDWGGEGEFIHARIAPGETYRVYEFLEVHFRILLISHSRQSILYILFPVT